MCRDTQPCFGSERGELNPQIQCRRKEITTNRRTCSYQVQSGLTEHKSVCTQLPSRSPLGTQEPWAPRLTPFLLHHPQGKPPSPGRDPIPFRASTFSTRKPVIWTTPIPQSPSAFLFGRFSDLVENKTPRPPPCRIETGPGPS